MSVNCVASNFLITINEDAFAFRYNVGIVYHQEEQNNTVYMTENSDDLTKKINKWIIDHMIPELENIPFVYDDINLWTSKNLEKDLDYSIPEEKIPSSLTETLLGKGVFKVFITSNMERPIVNLNDSYNIKSSNYWIRRNFSIRNLLELIIFEHAIKTGSCKLKYGYFHGLEKEINRGLIIWHGCKPWIQECSSESGTKLILPLDSITKTFYPETNFLEAVKQFLGDSKSLEEATILFQNIKLRSSFFPGKIFTFKEFGKSVNEIKDIDIIELCKGKYNVELKHLDEPTAFLNEVGGNFPLELLEIIPDQLVPYTSLLDLLDTEYISHNIIDPGKRYHKIMKIVKEFEFNNPITQAFGITVSEEMMKIRCKIFPKPQLIAGEDAYLDTESRFIYYGDDNKFYIPAKIESCGIICEFKDKDVVEKFAQEIRSTSISMGMDFPIPSIFPVNSNDMSVDEWVDILTSLGAKYVMVISEEEEIIDNLYLAEILTPGIIVHQKRLEIVIEIGKGDQTMCRYACFLNNAKNNGLNYKIVMDDLEDPWDVNDGKVLIIGLDLYNLSNDNNVKKPTLPSVIGFSANYSKHPCLFLGNFSFQDPREQYIDPNKLQTYIQQVFENLQKKENGKSVREHPTHIVIFRNRIHERQYKAIINEEFTIMKDFIITNYYQNKKPPRFVFILIRKQRNIRHFLKNDSEINLKDSSETSLKNDSEITTENDAEINPKEDFEDKIEQGLEDNREENSVVDTKEDSEVITENNSEEKSENNPTKNSGIQSPPAGCFIDDGTRSDLIQFYMTPHVASMGSSQSTLVTVFVNEPRVSKNTIKKFIYYLCYSQQIYRAPTSTPGVVDRAIKMAERGLSMYKVAKKNGIVQDLDPDYLTSKLSHNGGRLLDIN